MAGRLRLSLAGRASGPARAEDPRVHFSVQLCCASKYNSEAPHVSTLALHFAILSRCDPLLSVSPLVTSRVRLRIRTAAHTFLVLCAASLLCAAAWDGFFRVPAGPVLRPPPLDRARARPLAAGYARQRTFTGIPALCRCGATMMRSVLLLFLLP